MAKRIIAVGEVIHGKEVLAVTTKKGKPTYEVKNLACGHVTIIASFQLLYPKPVKVGHVGCAICGSAARTHDCDMVGRRTGTFECTGVSDQRRKNRPLYVCRCTVCGQEDTLDSAFLCNGHEHPCATCKKIRMETIRANPRRFTDEEVSLIENAILAGIRTISGNLKTVSHTRLDTTEDDCIQAAWTELLTNDLTRKSFDSVCALACGIAKNQARRVYNKVNQQFKEPYILDGEMVEPLDFVPNHEPDYDFESVETVSDRENLQCQLAALTPEERSLLLSDMDNLTSNQKTKYTLLVQRLKNTLTSPCCQIIPLT